MNQTNLIPLTLPNRVSKVSEWKNLLMEDLAWSKMQIDTHIHRLLSLFKHLEMGSAALAYRSKQGEVKLTIASLTPYATYFHHPFRWEELRNTIPFWNEEQHRWNTFDMSNFIDWKVVYPIK